MRVLVVVFAVFAGLAGCTKPNPNLCCNDPTDCSSHGVPMGSTCAQGLICRANQCIAETCSAATDCEPSAPYCIAQLCSPACTQNSDCPGFGQETGDTICANGSCVECAASSDCPATKPVCDANACRICKDDTDCASGACGADGACVDSASIVYVDGTNGMDAGSCSQQAPCKTIQFGIKTAVPTRSHIVIAPGTYVELVHIDSTDTSAPSITIHGHGALVEPPSGGDLSNVYVGEVSTTIEDVVFPGNASFGYSIQSASAPCTLARVAIQNAGGIQVGSNMMIEQVTMKNVKETAISIGATSHLVLDRLSIEGGASGIVAGNAGAIVSMTNLLIFDVSDKAMDLSGATGTVAFATIGDSGGGAAVVTCPSGIILQSSIVWTPGSPPISGTCALNTVIAGPTTVTGAMNTDPKFANEPQRDYHLTTASPAKDLVGSGPSTDLDGTSRPQGTRFDIGAFEATN